MPKSADPVQLGPLKSEIHLLKKGPPKARQLEKRLDLHRSNSDARGQVAFKFNKMVLCGSAAPWLRGRCGIVKTHLGSNRRWRTTLKFLIYGPRFWNG